MFPAVTVVLVAQPDDPAATAVERLPRATVRRATETAICAYSDERAGDIEPSVFEGVDLVVASGTALEDSEAFLTTVEQVRPTAGILLFDGASDDASVIDYRLGEPDCCRELSAMTRVRAAVENCHAIPAETAVAVVRQAFDDTFETVTDVGRRIVTTAVDGLVLPYVGAYFFDEERGVLTPVARSPALMELVTEPYSIGPEHTSAWHAFSRKTTVVLEDEDPLPNSPIPADCAVVAPIGDVGIVVAGTTCADAVGSSTVAAIELLATTADLAVSRVYSDRAREDCEQQLDQQRTRLSRVQQINEKVRKMDQALVQAKSRQEIEQTVCERLLTSERFAFAWIGELDVDGNGIQTRSMAGSSRNYLDAISLSLEADQETAEPAVRAIRSGEVTIEPLVTNDLREAPWREEALLRDFLSVASIPLIYGDVTYGVVTVYATEPAAFDHLAVSVLSEMGETIGYAINAAERRVALASDSVTELKLRLQAPEDVFSRLAQQFDCRIAIESLASRPEDETLIYATIPDAPDELIAVANQSVSVERAKRVSEFHPDRFEFIVSGSPLPVALADREAIPDGITVVDGQLCATVTHLEQTSARSFVERLQDKYGDVTLLAQRERERSDGPAQAPRAANTFTDRQREVFEAAYYNGYFEWPREQTGEEVAATLGISQPAFLQHLRTCERKLAHALCEQEH